MVTDKDIKEMLPTKRLKPGLHRIKIGDEVYDLLEVIRRKYRLWDREAAIIWLLKEAGLWEEEPEE